MFTFILIIACVVVLNLGLFGLGRGVVREAPAAAAALAGWALFLFIGAAAWFAKLGAAWLAPVAVVVLGAGWWFLFHAMPRATIGILAAGSTVIAALFALPFLLHPGLLAYSHWGTDQWGYISVARWLVDHSVDQLPAIDNKPGRDWIWYVLTVKDRPLIYETLALIAATFRIGAHIAYYVLPAALGSGVFAALFLAGSYPAGGVKVGWRGSATPPYNSCDLNPTVTPPWPYLLAAARFFLALGVTLQPILLLHFQYQFLGGAVAGLLFMLLVAAVLQIQAAGGEGRSLFYAFTALFGVLLAGIYSVKITLVALGIVFGAAGFTAARELWRRKWSWTLLRPRPAGIGVVVILAVAGISLLRIRALMPEPWSTPPVHGAVGHLWAHFGALFGLLDILPWYQPDGAPGNLDPVQHNPPGGGIGAALIGILLVLLVVQSWRWFRQHRDLAPAIVLGAIVAVAWLASPPRGSHWNVGRALPVFGPALLVAAALMSRLPGRRWLGWLGVGLACLPIVRAAPALWPYFTAPVNRMTPDQWDAPPEGNPWGALGYAYFYEDTREIDWTKAPECFRAMTHYMPENLRPTLPEKTPAR